MINNAFILLLSSLFFLHAIRASHYRRGFTLNVTIVLIITIIKLMLLQIFEGLVFERMMGNAAFTVLTIVLIFVGLVLVKFSGNVINTNRV